MNAFALFPSLSCSIPSSVISASTAAATSVCARSISARFSGDAPMMLPADSEVDVGPMHREIMAEFRRATDELQDEFRKMEHEIEDSSETASQQDSPLPEQPAEAAYGLTAEA